MLKKNKQTHNNHPSRRVRYVAHCYGNCKNESIIFICYSFVQTFTRFSICKYLEHTDIWYLKYMYSSVNLSSSIIPFHTVGISKSKCSISSFYLIILTITSRARGICEGRNVKTRQCWSLNSDLQLAKHTYVHFGLSPSSIYSLCLTGPKMVSI